MTKETFETAYQVGFRTTVRILTSRGASHDSAEESAQAAWAKGWEARSQLRDPNRIVPWVTSIAVNHVCSDLRRHRGQTTVDQLSRIKQYPTIPAESEAKDLLRLCSKLDRSLLTDRYIAGLDISAIAQRHGMTLVGTRVRLHRAIRALRVAARRRHPRDEPQ